MLEVCLVEQRQLPAAGAFVVAQDINGIVGAAALEVAMLGVESVVQHLDELDGLLPQVEAPRRLLAAIAGVAFDANRGHTDIPPGSSGSRDSRPDYAALAAGSWITGLPSSSSRNSANARSPL